LVAFFASQPFSCDWSEGVNLHVLPFRSGQNKQHQTLGVACRIGQFWVRCCSSSWSW